MNGQEATVYSRVKELVDEPRVRAKLERDTRFEDESVNEAETAVSAVIELLKKSDMYAAAMMSVTKLMLAVAGPDVTFIFPHAVAQMVAEHEDLFTVSPIVTPEIFIPKEIQA